MARKRFYFLGRNLPKSTFGAEVANKFFSFLSFLYIIENHIFRSFYFIGYFNNNNLHKLHIIILYSFFDYLSVQSKRCAVELIGGFNISRGFIFVSKLCTLERVARLE